MTRWVAIRRYFQIVFVVAHPHRYSECAWIGLRLGRAIADDEIRETNNCMGCISGRYSHDLALVPADVACAGCQRRQYEWRCAEHLHARLSVAGGGGCLCKFWTCVYGLFVLGWMQPHVLSTPRG